MGAAAYEAEGTAAGSSGCTEPIRVDRARLAEVRAELAGLSEVPPGWSLSPRRFARSAAAFLAFVLAFYVGLRILFP